MIDISTPQVPENDSEFYKISWKEDIGNTFKESFSDVDISHLLNKLHSCDTENTNQDTIDSLVTELADTYMRTAQNVGICKKQTP